MKLKVSIDKVKELNSNSSKNAKKIFFLIALCILIIGSNIISNALLNKTVDIVTFKTALPQDARVTESNMVKTKMVKAEYEKQGIMKFSDGSKKRTIVLWEDRNKIKNAYASYYIRQNTPVHWDSLSKDTPKQLAYLYKMDGELLKLDIKADQFGEMLVPGDKINVRAAYTDQVYTLPSEEAYKMQQEAGIQPNTAIQRKVKLFNNAVVIDILNSDGASIFDIYYKLLALPKAKQQEIIATEDFKTSVKPVQILLNVTEEEADNYMDIEAKGANYMMTLLPRTNGNIITDALNNLQTGFTRESSSSDKK
ncbi:TPA: hypothetical protein KPJ62_003663 [Clostridioides difficile]|nr:hypothetical protein [Clostridioides difficile]